MSPPTTLVELYFRAMERDRLRRAILRYRHDGVWREVSGQAFADQVHAVSIGLRELGVDRGDRIAILSENRPEWAVTDFACLTTCAANVPIYPTLPPAQIAYLLRDSGARWVFVSNAAQLAKIREIRADLPLLQRVIVFDEALAADDVMTFAELAARGQAAIGRHPEWEAEARSTDPEDLATVIYTSGTTGEPKGVMLTHGNITSNVVASLSVLSVRPGDESLSFLPLSHIFERMGGHYVMFHAGVLINYARSVDTVAQDLLEVRPTVVTAVPRVFEKIHSRMVDSVATASPVKRRLFRWARQVAVTWSTERLARRAIGAGLALQHGLADRLVYRKLRARTGGRIRFFISGGAPLNAEIARFFHGAGLPILEGYGLTETSPVICVNTLESLRFGTVGQPLPGVEVRIAEDGEILTRGPHVMRGYYNKPEATREAITADGWFHTGDIGEIDAEGYLRITDRKKDLIVTAGGKNIAPQPIEGRLKANPYIANAVMIGDRRKFPAALLVPDFERLRGWASRHGIAAESDAELIQHPEVIAKMDAEAKKHLRDLAQFEVPKKFALLPRDFTIERGELTPKLSVRRRIVEEHFRETIASLYRDAESPG